MSSNKIFLVWVLSLLAIATSCQDRDFEDTRTSYKSSVWVQFLPKKGNENKELHITAINNTEFDNFSRSNTFNFPLNEQDDSTTFFVQSTSFSSPCTIVIRYQRIVSLLSHKRGAHQEFVLKEVQDTFAGEAKILKKHLRKSNETGPDVQIYF